MGSLGLQGTAADSSWQQQQQRRQAAALGGGSSGACLGFVPSCHAIQVRRQAGGAGIRGRQLRPAATAAAQLLPRRCADAPRRCGQQAGGQVSRRASSWTGPCTPNSRRAKDVTAGTCHAARLQTCTQQHQPAPAQHPPAQHPPAILAGSSLPWGHSRGALSTGSAGPASTPLSAHLASQSAATKRPGSPARTHSHRWRSRVGCRVSRRADMRVKR